MPKKGLFGVNRPYLVFPSDPIFSSFFQKKNSPVSTFTSFDKQQNIKMFKRKVIKV